MKILVVAATPFEIAPLREHLAVHFRTVSDVHFEKNGLEAWLLVTGVGAPVTAFSLGRVLAVQQFDWVVNAGVAGAFDRTLNLGEVVNVVSERFADLGAEEANGNFSDLQELGLSGWHEFPFFEREMHNMPAAEFDFLPKHKGLTVNTISGSQRTIEALLQKYPGAGIESMEGAAVFLACLASGQPFLELRSVSNYVEPLNRDIWNLQLAIDRLNETLLALLKTLTPPA